MASGTALRSGPRSAVGGILTIARSRALDHLRRADPAVCHPRPHTLLEFEPHAGGDRPIFSPPARTAASCTPPWRP